MPSHFIGILSLGPCILFYFFRGSTPLATDGGHLFIHVPCVLLLISPGLYLPARFAQVQGVQLPAEDPGDLLAASVDGTVTATSRHVGIGHGMEKRFGVWRVFLR
jgi:hypothetical protein